MAAQQYLKLLVIADQDGLLALWRSFGSHAHTQVDDLVDAVLQRPVDDDQKYFEWRKIRVSYATNGQVFVIATVSLDAQPQYIQSWLQMFTLKLETLLNQQLTRAAVLQHQELCHNLIGRMVSSHGTLLKLS